ncbi:hypothetical protein ACWCPQ_14660 [Nocardia sp. NPDC001965]
MPETEPKPPEPAVVRGFLVALLGLIGAVVGKQLDASWIDDFLTVYMVVAPLGLAWWIRRHVTPFKRGSE